MEQPQVVRLPAPTASAGGALPRRERNGTSSAKAGDGTVLLLVDG